MLLSKSSSSKDYFRSGLKAIGFVTKNEALDKKNFGPINVVHIPSKLLDVRNAKYWIPKNVKEAKAIQNTVSELGFDIDISPLTNFRAGLLDTEDKDGINRAADEMASMWGDYLKQIKPKTHCLIETKLNKHEKFLANMLLLIDANTSSGYSRYFDFVQFHTVEDNSKLVWKSHRQVPRKKEMVHLGKTLAKFESLTQRDLKSDNVDAVLKRAICFISMLLFKSTKMKPKNFSEEPDYKTDHELELGFTPGKIKHFSYQDFSRLRIILTKILLLIGNYDFIDYFFKLDPSLFSSEILTDLILEKVRDGQLNDASEYLAALKKNERFSSKITMLEEELARGKSVV